MTFDIIAFDADDTLWENEVFYTRAQSKLQKLLAKYLTVEDIHDAVYQTETRNIAIYGYGIKSFTLSMIETAITLTGGQISAGDIQQIIGFGKEMLTADIQLLTGAKKTLQELAETYSLMMVTKGDLLDQKRKVDHTSIGNFFDYIEIVSEKNPADYQVLLSKYNLQPEKFLMVGNSLRSDSWWATRCAPTYCPWLSWAGTQYTSRMPIPGCTNMLSQLGNMLTAIQ